MHVIKFSAYLAAFLILLGVCPSRADDAVTLTLQQLLGKHLQARGPQALQEPATERETGTLDYGGLHGTYTIISQGRDRYWSEEKLGLADDTTGTDGKLSWQRDSDGNQRLLSEPEIQYQRNTQYIDSLSYAVPNRLVGTVTLRPRTERKTGDYILDILPDGGKPSTLFLDPKTFLLVKEEHASDDVTDTTIYSDYRLMHGTMQAMMERVSDGDRKYDEVYTTTDLQDDVPVNNALFSPPPIAKNYQWVGPKTDPKAASAIIPFDSSDHRINLYVGINGEAANIVLDSGDADMSLAKWASDRLKLKPEGTFEARGYGGSTSIYPVHLDNFEVVGGVLFHNMTGTAIDLPDDFGRYEATPTVGFIGYKLLSRLVVQIDYQAQHMTLYDPETWQPTAADGQALPMDLTDNVPNVQAQFDGLPPGRFLVDTGDALSPVKLYGPFVSRNRVAQTYPKGMEIIGEGVGGESRARRVRAHSFTLAGFTLRDVPTDLSLDAKGGASRFLAGALGNDFLSHFIVTFDYPHSRIFFAPNLTAPKTFDTRTFGLYVVSQPDDLVKNKRQIQVVYVEDKAPAARAGVMRGTIITKIDGQSAEALGLGEVRRLLSPDGGKDTHVLTIIGPEGGMGDVKVSLYDPMPPQ